MRMQIGKKLAFSIPFLACFYWFNFSLSPYFKDIYLAFSWDPKALAQLPLVILFLCLADLFFILFISFCNDWKLILPASIAASIAPLIFLPAPLGLMIAVGTFLSFLLITYFTLKKLKNYVNFDPINLFNPYVKNLTALLILFISIAFFFQAKGEIKTKGFEIPDSFIDTAINLSGTAEPQVKGIKIAQGPAITKEQIELLRKYPDLLKQYGITAAQLDELEKQTPNSIKTVISLPGSNEPTSIKSLVKDQLQKSLKPYFSFIPIILGVLFFVQLESAAWFILIFSPLLITLVFLILEKSGFVKFTTEMRPVKKMVL